ncbi:MAG: TetR family transcriptional regulator [Persicimonas sp.]
MTGSGKAEQGAATRDALLTSAREAFAEHGYAQTAVDDIVERADVTKGAFYHHFSGKKEIFVRVFEEVKKELSRAAFVTHVDHEPFGASEERRRRLNRFVEQDNDEVWVQLVERCRRYVELHTAPEFRRITLDDARGVLTWSERQRVESEYGVVLLRADLRRAMRRGILRQLPLRELSVILTGALNEACLLIAHAEDNEDTRENALAVLDEFLNALRVSEEGGGDR